MDQSARAIVDASRERLQRFVDATSNGDLSRPIDDDWTGSALLAHLAFWDRRAARLIRRCQQGTCVPSSADEELINQSALPQWRLIPPRSAAQEALDAAAAIDGLLAEPSAEQLARLRHIEVNYDRSKHRNEHLDYVERNLNQGKSPLPVPHGIASHLIR
jgi:hypothetical protein